MGDIDKARIGREARDAVGAQRPTTGENRVQAAMRRYLGAVVFRSQEKGRGEDKERSEIQNPDDEAPPKDQAS